MQYYVVKDDVDRIASERGTSVDAILENPPRGVSKEALRLMQEGGPTRDSFIIDMIASSIHTEPVAFTLCKTEPFDTDRNDFITRHKNDPLDYNPDNFSRSIGTGILYMSDDEIDAFFVKGKLPD